MAVTARHKGSRFDVLTATDLRFPGGSSGSTAEEILAQSQAGLRSGLIHAPSTVFRRPRAANLKLRDLVSQHHAQLVHRLSYPAGASACLLIVRHPTTFNVLWSELPQIDVETVVLVVNHPPRNAAGRLDYDLEIVSANIRRWTGREPLVATNSPTLIPALRAEFGEHCVGDEVWFNIFDAAPFNSSPREAVRTPPRIGRHSRPGVEKWPDRREDILAAYPADPELEVRILGGVEKVQQLVGPAPPNWIVYPFGSREVPQFLQELDIFVYFHHPDWTEGFSRAVAEALASGLPAVLPPYFRDLLGEAALYADLADAGSVVRRLINDRRLYHEQSVRARAFVDARFSHRAHIERIRKMGVAAGGLE